MRFYARDKPRTAAVIGWVVSLSARWLMLFGALSAVLASCLWLNDALPGTVETPLWAIAVRAEWLSVFAAPASAHGKYERFLPNVPVSWKMVRVSVLFAVLPLVAVCALTGAAWIAAVLWAPSAHWLIGCGVQLATYLVSVAFVDSLDRYKPATVSADGVGRATAWEMEQLGMD